MPAAFNPIAVRNPAGWGSGRLAADIRAGLCQRMLDSPLMDGPSVARDMEAFYRRVWRTWCERAGGRDPTQVKTRETKE